MQLSRGQKAHRTRLIHAIEPSLPKRKLCPKCHKQRATSKFGLRVPRDAAGHMGKPRMQSYCIDCRSGHKPEEKTLN